jgi:hypothetical protein
MDINPEEQPNSKVSPQTVEKQTTEQTPEDHDRDQEELSDEAIQRMALTQNDGIKVILQSRLIVLSPLTFEDFPLTRVLVNSNLRTPTEYQSLIMAKLINNILARSKLTPEETAILRGGSSQDLLRTYHTIGAAVEGALTEILSG